jgi:hypothetical protein
VKSRLPAAARACFGSSRPDGSLGTPLVAKHDHKLPNLLRLSLTCVRDGRVQNCADEVRLALAVAAVITSMLPGQYVLELRVSLCGSSAVRS